MTACRLPLSARPEVLLRAAFVVRIGRIEVVHTQVDGLVDDGLRPWQGRTSLPNGLQPESDGRHTQAGGAELTVLHVSRPE